MSLLTSSAHAASVVIDFGDANGAAGGNYNTIANPGAGSTGYSGALVGSFDLTDFGTGLDSTWDLNISSNSTQSGDWGDGGAAGNYTGTVPAAVSGFSAAATGDHLYMQTDTTHVDFAFTNLTASTEYSFLIYGSRGNEGGEASYDVTLGSGTGGPSAAWTITIAKLPPSTSLRRHRGRSRSGGRVIRLVAPLSSTYCRSVKFPSHPRFCSFALAH